MSRAIDKETMLDLIIKAKRTDPETGSFAEWLAEYLVEHLPTLTPQNEPLSILVLDEPDREYIDYICPKCKNTISQRRRGQLMRDVYQCKYHDNCGQRVDWHNPQLYHIPSADKMKDCPPEGEA